MTRPDGLVIGTRGSPLALAQARMVASLLTRAAGPEAAGPTILEIRTTGDAITDRPLAELGGKGLFTKEIDEALLDGRCDLAVHSMKDLPTVLPDGIVITAVLERADVRDVLLGAPALADLPRGAVVGTASLRRKAQVLASRPDIVVVPLRGNVETRLAKLRRGDVQATLLAAAGLARLGIEDHGGSFLDVETMLPAVAQGAIAVVCRSGDEATGGLAAMLDHGPSAVCVAAERAMLAVLDGSCQTPIAGLARLAAGVLSLDGLIAAPDGSAVVRGVRVGPEADAVAIGRGLGDELRRKADPAWYEAR